jgi:hypothetical protein
MFGSSALEVGVGIALLFLFVSLICTSFQEGLEAILKSRASDLERGIRLLLHDPQGSGATKTFFAHPLIYSLFKGQYQPGSLVPDGKGGLVMPRADRANLPSYIPAANFSAALIDLVATGRLSAPGASVASAAGQGAKPRPATLAEWRRAADAITGNDPVARAVRSAFELAGGDLQAARTNLESWYNGTMDRVSGWYKRRAQFSLFLVGLLIAMGLNIDAITIVRELSVNADLRKAALTVAENTVADRAGTRPAEGGQEAADRLARARADYEMARQAIEEIGYPVGWRPAPQLKSCGTRAVKTDASGDATDGATRDRSCNRTKVIGLLLLAIPGWLSTALAVMLGAPFWFDVLNKFMVIRSTVKPYEKSTPEGSEDRKPAQPVVAGPRSRGASG